MITFTIPSNVLIGLSVFTPAKDKRTHLQGVAFICKQNQLSIVATNGHCLGCLDMALNAPDFEFIVSNETIKMLSVFKGKNIIFNIDNGKFTANDIQFLPIKEKYVNFERVLHSSDKIYNGVPANIDFELLALFSKFSKIMGCSKVSGRWNLKHNGGDRGVGVYTTVLLERLLQEHGFSWRGVVMPHSV